MTDSTHTETHTDLIQAELDRLTAGQAEASENADVLGCSRGYAVEITDGQGGGTYDPQDALDALKSLASEDDDSRDALWSALESAEVTF